MQSKFPNIFLGITLVLSVFILFVLVYTLTVLIPHRVSEIFGPPSEDLERSREIIYAFRLLINQEKLLKPNKDQTVDTVFVIHQGMSAAEIAGNLESQEIISDAESFIDFLIYKGIDRKIQAGVYRFRPDFKPNEIAGLIYDTNPADITFSFLAGWRVEEIAELIPYSGLEFSTEDFLQSINTPITVGINGQNTNLPFLEGFLFPDSYTIERTATPSDVVGFFTNRFFEELPSDYAARVGARGLTLYEAVTLASIVQKELVMRDEAPLIASVFLNRLSAGMPLQSDPTVQYALGYVQEQQTWWKNPLEAADMDIDSRYNTYRFSGLPTGPICNPDLDALLSIVSQVQTDFFYFRSSCDGSGSHVFSETYEEHSNSVCK